MFEVVLGPNGWQIRRGDNVEATYKNAGIAFRRAKEKARMLAEKIGEDVSVVYRRRGGTEEIWTCRYREATHTPL
jgi:hypothetical protein